MVKILAGDEMKQRCDWAERGELIQAYHDTEWGVPVHEDRLLFEFLILEGAQAGLSWSTILRKRPEYRQAFDNFQARIIAGYSEADLTRLLENPGIVRNRRKISAAVANARAFAQVQQEFGSFDCYIWQFVQGQTIQNSWQTLTDIPSRTPESQAMSKDLRQRGFLFVGPTICYSFMQAVGLVNDHLVHCFRHRELQGMTEPQKGK